MKFHENPVEVTVQWEPRSFMRTEKQTDRQIDRQPRQTDRRKGEFSQYER